SAPRARLALQTEEQKQNGPEPNELNQTKPRERPTRAASSPWRCASVCQAKRHRSCGRRMANSVPRFRDQPPAPKGARMIRAGVELDPGVFTRPRVLAGLAKPG